MKLLLILMVMMVMTKESTKNIAAAGSGCDGGDGCCFGGNCGEGEGDCDNDSDCLPGHHCGHDNCPAVPLFDWDDDCCVNPGTACLGGDTCCVNGNCGVGEGDCDNDSDCRPGLQCGSDNCPATGTFQPDDDCCFDPTEELCDGGDSCCVNGICGVGEGDCDNDSDCQPGLRCGTDNCPLKSSFQADDDCCYDPASFCDGGDSCCVNGNCGVGEGDCDLDSDCKPGLHCGHDNCPALISFDNTDDCCVDSGNACLGGDSCCVNGNCGVGEGDCDSDSDCKPGLLCGVDNCPPTGSFQPDDDCCYNPGTRKLEEMTNLQLTKELDVLNRRMSVLNSTQIEIIESLHATVLKWEELAALVTSLQRKISAAPRENLENL